MKPKSAAATKAGSWVRFVVPIGWMAAIYVGSDQNHLPGPEGIPFFDKFAHFGAYGLLGTLWSRALAREGSSPWRSALFALAICSLYGATDEWHQSLRPGRDVEFGDWVADTLGAALAVGLYYFSPVYRRLMDLPLDRKPRTSAESAAETAVASAAPEHHR